MPVTPPVVPTPDVHAAPCYLCPGEGTAYLTAPATLALTVPGTTDLPAGCECPGCIEARALIDATTAAAESDTPGIAPEDGVNYLALCQITTTRRQMDPWSAASPTSALQVGLCPEHADIVSRALDNGNSLCAWCSCTLDSTLSDLGLSLDARTITEIRIAQRGSLSREISPRFRVARAIRPVAPAADEQVCQNCYDTSQECGDCSITVRDGYGYYCEECETDVCRGCWDGSHSRHSDRGDGYDRARYNFAPRQTIEGALGLVGAAGSTILSTRALGIEIETARGNAQVVIDHERVSAIPVLQAVGTDGSVRGRNPVEYRLLPARGAFAEYAIRSMSTWCREADYNPDSSAGIHMHVDCSAHSPEQVWRAFAALVILEPVLFSHSANHRMTSQYCQGYGSDGPRIVDAALAASERSPRYFEPDEIASGSRYRSVNCHSFSNHRTLEVRVFDSAHDEEAVERFTDAAAIIAGAVDFAVSSEWHMFAAAPRTDRAATVMRLLGGMVVAGHITSDTMARAMQRLDARTLVAA